MKPPRHTYLTGSRSKKGFALLITITLLAFLVLLLVSLASLTRVETQVANNSQQLSSARQNAMMALNIAIGQLQQAAGPDQRVTARAEILDTDSSVLRSTGGGTAMKQPLWTGVWKTNKPGASDQQLDIGSKIRDWSVGSGSSAGTATSDTKASNANMAWMVSGATDNTSINPAKWTATAANSVKLASGLGGGATTVDVDVPTVDLKATPPGFTSEQTVGKYAYWVSDEGVKARVNLVDTTLSATSGSVSEKLHYLVPQANASHKIAGLVSAPSMDFRSDNNSISLSNLLALDSIKFLETSAATLDLKKLSPDITTYSASVLADVRNGGLKKDLTAALESADEFDRMMGYVREYTKGDAGDGAVRKDYAGDERVYRFPGPVNGSHIIQANRTGLRWLSVYNYYNLYKSSYDLFSYSGINGAGRAKTTSKVAGMPSPGSGSIPMRLYGYSFGDPKSGATVNGTSDPLMPRPVSLAIYVGFTSEKQLYNPADPLMPTPPGAGKSYYKLRIHYVPQLILHNPYNVTLTVPVSKLQFNITSNVLTGPNSNGPTWTIKVGSAEVQKDKSIVWDGSDITKPYAGGSLSLTTDPSVDLTFEPGQIRVFGLMAPLSVPTTNVPVFTSLVDDYVPGVGQYAFVKDGKKDNTDWMAICDDSDVVTVQWTKQGNFNSNNGRFKLKLNGSDWNNMHWPKGNGTELGRFFLNNTNAISNLNPQSLGTISSLTSGLNKVSSSIAQIIIRSRGARPNDKFKNPIFNSAADLLNPLVMDRDSGMQEVVFGFSPSTVGSFPPENAIAFNPASGKIESYWGKFSAGADANDQSRVVLKDIPRIPMASIGQLQHLTPSYGIGSNTGFGGSSVLYPVGGSIAHVYVPSASSYAYNPLPQSVPNDPSPTLICDDNFLNNEALFDRYFLSTVPSAYQDSNAASYYPFKSFNDSYVSVGGALPNNRYAYYKKDGKSPTVEELRKYDIAASKLMLNGGFNINSTSVEAWKAFLASVSGVALTGVSKQDSAFLRSVTLTGGLSGTSLWGGVTKLTDTQIKELATSIVAEVKARGPFLSLGDFLNRRLVSSTDPKSRRGALQAAIDNTSINNGVSGIGITSTTTAPGQNNHKNHVFELNNLQQSDGSYPNTAQGIPGTLMQGDLVQALSAAMTPRSDTFVIRFYGESINPTTQVSVSKVFGEAVVQRIPDYVSSTDSAEVWDDASKYEATDTSKFTYSINALNQAFGRRFKIINFRWLALNEI